METWEVVRGGGESEENKGLIELFKDSYKMMRRINFYQSTQQIAMAIYFTFLSFLISFRQFQHSIFKFMSIFFQLFNIVSFHSFLEQFNISSLIHAICTFSQHYLLRL